MSLPSVRPFSILTEVSSDLPASYLKKHGVIPIPILYTIEGTDYDGSPEHSLPLDLFYDKLRKGASAKTAAVSIEASRQCMEGELKKGNDILYIGFSSGLSSSFQNGCLAAEALRQEYPDAQVRCVDSLCASLGQGLLVNYAVQKQQELCSLEDTARAVEEIRPHLCHYFPVDDLIHLYRGGRVSKTAAIFGTMLGIKPVMHVDDEGQLIPHAKVRGRRAALDQLVKNMEQKLSPEYPNPYVFISHGDCLSDAKYVAEQVKSKFKLKTEILDFIGPVIGSHSGPGTVALFFLGENRTEKKL